MPSTRLDYVSPDVPRSRRRVWRWVGAVAVLSVLTSVVPGVAVRQVESGIDRVTGSTTSKTVWLFGITSGPRVDVSPLETRLKRSGIQWNPTWRFLHNTHYNVFGVAIRFECGSAPPIYELGPLLEMFAAAATDAELRDFVQIMQSGSDAEQEAAVEAASERAFQTPSKPRSAD